MSILKQWAIVCLLALWVVSGLSSDAMAQTTANCTGVPAWSGSTIYNAGDKFVYQGSLYQANIQIWNTPPTYCPSCGWYTNLGTCGGGGSSPTVSISAPANNASFPAGTAITVSADAADSDGTVAKVEFFDSGAKIGEDTAAPFSISWSSAVAGAHQLTAKATDNAGNATTSAAVTVNLTCTGSCGGGGPLPKRALIGYWHNFDNGSGFIKLRDVSPDWDLVNIAFGEPVGGSTSRIGFTPFQQTTTAEMQSDIAILHGRGKKVLLSVGGANGHVVLPTSADRQNFVDSVTSIIQLYGLDGLDIDFEGSSVRLNANDRDFMNPTTPSIVNLISAVREIRSRVGSGFILTMAPETWFVQVGYQFYGSGNGGDGRTGAYLPIIHALRDILTVLHVQDYNSGAVLALDGRAYGMGNADFHTAMTDMVLAGFNVANTGKFFPGLRPDQVGFGLPANGNAGNGFTPVPEVQKALNYLIKGQSFGGQYVLRNPAGYPSFRGLMAWSINWDRVANFDFSKNHRAYFNTVP
ncbi:chitinase [Pendulispora albinea]|uniref:chitinase n=1 Tax=Pendulispora albinea TaxID=2741071 RepID=A0ABZ2M364_9BACT